MRLADGGHISIGDVLTLLQERFPDLSVSKIRFLESQGLIAPERTAAGYRRFYLADVERLEWILTMQKERFLPLRVIREMLDAGADPSWAGPAQATLFGATPPPGPTGAPAQRRPRSGDGPSSSADVALGLVDWVDSEHGVPAGSVPDHGEPVDAQTVAAGQSVGPEPVVAAGQSVTPAPTVAAGEPADVSQPGDGGRSDEVGSGAMGSPPSEVGGGRTQPGSSRSNDPAAWLAALQERPPRHATPSKSVSVDLREDPHEDLLTALELAETAGITVEHVRSLVEFGLVVPGRLGGEDAFGSTALEIARVAAEFIARGIEPRHLRAYKLGVEREVGLFEQLVAPLVRQRNPTARMQAAEELEALASQGSVLREALLRQALRGYLP